MSALAKAKSLDLLKQVFPNKEFMITEYVQDELMRAKEEGFDYPNRIFEFCETTTLKETELKNYKVEDSLEISKTDLKNLIIAENRKIPLLTNDSKLYQKAKKKDIRTYDLRQILKALKKEKKITKNELINTIEKIEQKDHTKIKEKQEILKQKPTNRTT